MEIPLQFLGSLASTHAGHQVGTIFKPIEGQGPIEPGDAPAVDEGIKSYQKLLVDVFDPHLISIHKLNVSVTFSYDQICEGDFSTVFL